MFVNDEILVKIEASKEDESKLIVDYFKSIGFEVEYECVCLSIPSQIHTKLTRKK